MRLGDLNLKKKMMLGNSIALVLVMILGGITFNATSQLLKSSKMVDHTHIVIEKAMDILGSAVDMETGMRGYLLAGQDKFLEPYTNGYKSFQEGITVLKKTVSDNPAQVTLLAEVEKNINEWVKNVTEPTILLRRDIGNAKTMDDMADIIGQAKGKVYFDKFRNQIAVFIEREETLLTDREQKADKNGSSIARKNSATWVKHTQIVIKEAMKIESAAVDMETGMRGYLLAGKEGFLAPYINGNRSFQEKVESLKITVRDNPAQVRLLTEIQTNINAWKKNVTEPAIELRRVIGDAKTMNDMASLVGEARGKVYFDKSREQIGTFIKREQALMVIRQKAASDKTIHSEYIIVAGTIAIILISLIVSGVVTGAITRPINRAVKLADSLAKGDMTQRLNVDTLDEVGTLSEALNKIAEDLGSMLKNVQNSTNVLAESSNKLTTVSSELSDTSDETSGRANDVASASEKMSANMGSVSAAMEQSASNVGMIVTATEEMSATVSDIAQDTERARVVAEDAVDQTQKTSSQVNDLGEVADKIGKITEVITGISEQTNLLALNATIEAARAGDAGKGFAVVANEIKDLAKQTAEATVDIKNQIEGMQDTTKSTISGIHTISEVIGEINEIIISIASAVEQQSAVTTEISQNVSQASDGINDVNVSVANSSASIEHTNRDIGEISRGADQIRRGSLNVTQSANELSELSEQLGALTRRFKVA